MYRPEEGCIMCEDDPQFCGPFCTTWRDSCRSQRFNDYLNNCEPQPRCEGCKTCFVPTERADWLNNS